MRLSNQVVALTCCTDAVHALQLTLAHVNASILLQSALICMHSDEN